MQNLFFCLFVCYWLVILTATGKNDKKLLSIFHLSGYNHAVLGLGSKGFSIGKTYPFDTDEENKGLLVAVVHQSEGRSMIRPYHFQIWSDFSTLINFLNKIQPGRIILFTLKGELSFKIPSSFRNYLKELGSFGARLLGRGVGWSWVFIKGGKTLKEDVSYRSSAFNLASVIQGAAILELAASQEYCFLWPNTSLWNVRRRFCDKYEMYGDLCSCSDPNHLNYNPKPITNNAMNSAVTSIIGYRPSLLYESLKSLLPNPGLNRSLLQVFNQEQDPEMEQLLTLVGVPVISSGLPSDGSANTILRQYVFVFKYVMSHHENSEFFVFLEDDVRYSPDLYIFFNRTTQLLREDRSLYCSSAHNDISYAQTSFDPTAAIRTESHPSCGWMVRKEFLNKLLELEKWKEEEADWDVITFNYLRGKRECIVPEVSRSQHFGIHGAHVNSYKARLYFSSKNYNLDSAAPVENVHLLQKGAYEKHLDRMLRNSTAVDTSICQPCSHEFYEFLHNSSHNIMTIYFYLETLEHFVNNEEYSILSECLNIYSNSAKESHFGLFRMRWRQKHLFLVGYPSSKYSTYKPFNTTVFRSNSATLAAAREHLNKRFQVENPYFKNISYYLQAFFL